MLSVSQIILNYPACNRPSHNGELVKAICLREGCTEVKAVCFKCIIEFHKNCIPSIKVIEEVPQLLQPFFQFEFEVSQLQQQNNRELKDIINEIEVILKPIKNYHEQPNLKNLNDLGSLLQKSFTFLEQVKVKLEKCKNKIEIKGPSNKPEIVPQEDSQSPENFLNQGSALYKLNRYLEAINCFEYAIKINPKLSAAWFLNGMTLLKVDRFQDALNCFEEVIKIDPHNQHAPKQLVKAKEKLNK